MCNTTRKAPVQEFLKQRRLLCRIFLFGKNITKFLAQQQKSSLNSGTAAAEAIKSLSSSFGSEAVQKKCFSFCENGS